MKAEFICHKDFENELPIDVFHKETTGELPDESDEKFINRHIIFRRQIELSDVCRAILKISADDYYKLYINGIFAAAGPAPSYPDAYYYNEIDVSKYLKKGINTFAVHVYYQGLINRVWVSGDRRCMLYFDLKISGEQVLVSDERWRYHDHTAYSALATVGYKTAFTECYDSNSPEVGFESESYDDSAWENAKIYKNGNYTLQEQPTKLLTYENISPKTIEKHDGFIRIDFGREAVGYIRAKANGKRGDEITLLFGEELCEDGNVRYKLRANCEYLEKWILSGGDDELWQYDYKAFRYAQIHFPDGVKISDIELLARHYPFEARATYSSVTDPRLKAVIDLCSDTVKYGTQECYVDCPTREKGQYLGDVSIAARAQATVTRDTSLMKKALRNFFDSSFICDGLMAVSTSSYMQEIADYSLQIAASTLWVYRMDGDEDFLRYSLPYLEGVYRYFLSYAREDGLIDGISEKWNLVDWPANLRDEYDFPMTKPIGKGYHNVLNAFWYGFLSDLDKIYSILGIERSTIAEKVKSSFISEFYKSDIGLFTDTKESTHSAIHSSILPLLFGIGTEDEELKKRLIDRIKEKKLSSMGVYMAYFALAALIGAGEMKLAMELAADENAWLLMIREGATTTFEAWGKDQKWNTSLFHPWATAPLIVFADDTPVY